jgi:prophage antirepressor-like protein
MPENALSNREKALVQKLRGMDDTQRAGFLGSTNRMFSKTKEKENKMDDLQLVKSESFGTATCDFYSDGKDYYMTREQIGTALEYTNPRKAIKDIHARHKERLDKYSVITRLVATEYKGGSDCAPLGGAQETIIYNRKGIMEICRWSQQPGADAFMDWVWDVMDGLMSGSIEIKAKQHDLIKSELATAKLNNSRARNASMWLKISQQIQSPEYKQICASYASKALAGDMVIPLPASEEKHYKAGEIGQMFGLSGNKIGRIANANGMKTEEYGGFYHDKSPNSPKEVDTFMYNTKAISRFREIVGK